MRRLMVLLLSAVVLFANWNDTSIGIDLKRLKPFPLVKVRSGFLREGQKASFDGFVATSREREVILRGSAKSGKRWFVHIGDVAFDQVYRADLDGNGTQDYVIYGLNPFANGRTAAGSRITILLMDAEGLPVPYETYTYDMHPDRGPRALFDLRHDGHAQLLISSYDEIHWDGRVGAFASGHWISQLLEIRDSNWVEFRGSVSGLTFPFVHRWTYWPNEALEKSWPPDRSLSVPERSTAPSEIDDARITRLKEPIVGNTVSITPSPGCRDFQIGTVVYDQPARREISLYWSNPSKTMGTGFSTECKQTKHVRLHGVKRDRELGCSANLLWGIQ
jgi:hypothetical protein